MTPADDYSSPLISVIIPMRNGGQFIAPTIRSILSQEGVKLEVVVVNDGSTDDSPQTVREVGGSRVRMIDGPCRGISAALNAGLAVARGSFVARCDADDLYPPGRLLKQLNFLQENYQFGATSGGYSLIDSGNTVIRPFAPATEVAADVTINVTTNVPTNITDVTEELLNGIGRSHICAYLIHTKHLRRIGGFREWFITSEDADLQYRLAEVCRIAYQAVDVYSYRLHESSVTHDGNSRRIEFFSECAKQFLKQRRAGKEDDLQAGRPPTVPPPVSGNASAGGRSTRQQIYRMLVGDAWKFHDAGQRGRAMATGWQALHYTPTSPGAWQTILKLALKPTRRRKS